MNSVGSSTGHYNSQVFGRVVLVMFATLEAILVKTCPDMIPRRDIVAVLMALFGLIPVFMLTGREMLPQPMWPKTFVKKFIMLEKSQLVCTVIAPWVLIGSDDYFTRQKETSAVKDLLVSHLFVMQAQIVLECIIATTGHYPVTFPFTIVANIYRAVALVEWMKKSNHVLPSWQSRGLEWIVLVTLPHVAMILWIYFCLVFIPLEWYPLLAKVSLEQPRRSNRWVGVPDRSTRRNLSDQHRVK